jgi:hypothetical protein
MVHQTTILAKLCTCEKCGFSWILYESDPPIHCQNKTCQSREWNGVKRLTPSHTDEIKFPAVRSPGRPKTYPGGGGDGICLDNLDD